MHRAAGRLDGLHRGERRVQAFDASELALDGHRRRPLAGRLHPRGERGLQAVAVGAEGRQVGVVAVGRGRQVEQVEGAARRGSQVGRDGRDDAAGGTGDDEHGIAAEHHAVAGHGLTVVAQRRERCFDEGDAEAAVVEAADLDAARVEQRLLDQLLGDRGGLDPWRPRRPP